MAAPARGVPTCLVLCPRRAARPCVPGGSSGSSCTAPAWHGPAEQMSPSFPCLHGAGDQRSLPG